MKDMLGRRKRRVKRPSTWVSVRDFDRMSSFFSAIGWPVEMIEAGVASAVSTPGGPFGIRAEDPPRVPRIELALSVCDPVVVDELAEVVERAGGLLMEPVQETVWGGWGFSFNDPEGNNWEIGYPKTVTATDYGLSGRRPPADGPVVALVVPPPAERRQ
jgi:uncharacterized protein